MNLPACFLADLPAEATLTPTMITESCQALRRNREQDLAGRSTRDIIRVLDEVAQEWRRDSPFRRLALEEGPAQCGFPAGTLAAGLDAYFEELTPENLHRLIEQDLGAPGRLDPAGGGRAAAGGWARGPELLVHITAGNLPVPALHSIVLGLLMRSAQFVKCAQGTSFLPRLFAHSLREADPKLAGSLELAEWPGGTLSLEESLFAEADGVTATGGDETLVDIRRRLPIRTRFIGHGHRVSFGYLTRDALSAGGAGWVTRAADDVVAWNQQGCLSPHVFYVETGRALAPEAFAARLSEELAQRETTLPRGELSVQEAAVISLKRDFYRVRMAAACETRLWHSTDSTAWTVVFEENPLFQASCLNRFVYVKPVADVIEAIHAADAVRGQVSTVGLAAAGTVAAEVTTALARWGVTRVCPLGRMQRPPLTWRHDGRPALGDLITWTDCEP